MHTIEERMSAKNWMLLFTLSLLWGGSFFFVEIATRELPTLSIVALRLVLAALALNLFLCFKGIPLEFNKEHWKAYGGMGILNNIIPFTFIVWGQMSITGGLASIFNATTPIFTVIVAHFLTADEKLTLRKGMGIAMGFLGVVCIIGFDALTLENAPILGQLAIMCAALSYAFGGIFGRRFKKMNIPALHAATGQLSASSLLFLPIVLIFDTPWNHSLPSSSTWMAIIALALLSTSLAYLIFFRILASAGATNVMLVTFLIPPSAIVLGAMFLDEQLALTHFLGMGCILAGLVIIDGRIVKWFKEKDHAF